MKLLLNARNFTDPTLDTLRDYSLKKFRKLLKFAPRRIAMQPLLQVSADYNNSKKMFDVKIIFTLNRHSFVFTVDDKDLRRAIDIAENNIRRQLIAFKDTHLLYS